ncbi:DNA-binding protein [uncultured Fusobacterium sp.]|uniref:DNA-binding protein n=1 Tax=uncultured Fusobacterium sp. TaxID=159267 RepID=UPI0025F45063|nr:DNA-binding protein [uncultured Fusobacterium sp.]
MNNEEYILKKLESLSPVDKALVEKIAAHLGEWATVEEVAKYFKKHRNTICEKINNGDILYRRIGVNFLIYTRSLIFLLE